MEDGDNTPRGVRDLFRRLDILEGIPMGILASNSLIEKLENTYELKKEKPWNSLRSWHADVVEEVLGVSKNNHKGRDLDYAEIKIIPIEMPAAQKSKLSKWPVPKEDTKICSFNYDELIENEFMNSHIYRKLTSVIFVPIQRKYKWKNPEKIDYMNMYMVNSFMWIPNKKIISDIENEYNNIRENLLQQINSELKFNQLKNSTEVLEIKLESGKILDPRTGGGKDGNSTSMITVKNKKYKVKKKSWFLKKNLTYKIMQSVMFGK